MTVYVDDMFKYAIGQFGRMKMSHMVADAESELHDMAAKIGVARGWYQGDHYDVSISKRRLAVSLGAVEVTYRQLSCMCALRRYGYPLGIPDTAESILRQVRAKLKAANSHLSPQAAALS